MADQNGYAQGFSYDRQTGAISQDGPDIAGDVPTSTGKVRNGTSYGGYSGTVVKMPDGSYGVEQAHSGLADAVNRFQGLGASAAKRAAYQADNSAADAEAARGQIARGSQVDALQGLRNAAQGNAASMTAGMGHAMSDQGMQGALAATAGARGGLAQSAAAHAAYGQQFGAGVHGAGQLAGVRAGEMGAARGQFLAGGSALRGNDMSAQDMLQRREMLHGDSVLAQNGMNQAQQMGMEGLAYNARMAQLHANQKDQETAAGVYANNLSIDQQNKDRATKWMGAGAAAMGTGIGVMQGAMQNSLGPSQGGGGAPAPQGGGGGGDIIRDDPYAQQDDGSDPYGGIGR